MRASVFLLLIFLSCSISWGQTETDQQLAQHYFSSGDFEKAISYYERLFDKDPSKFHFNRYLECLVQTNNKKDAEKLLKKQCAEHRYDSEYKVLLGKFYEDNNENEKATDIYDELISDLEADANSIITLYNAFKSKSRNEFALKTLERGRKLLKDSYPLHFQFAEYYGSVGQSDKMLTEYLDLLDTYDSYASSIQTVLARQIDLSDENAKEADLLKTALLERVQKHPDKIVYSEMLIWLFVQKRNFSGALLQAQALDKRMEADGKRVLELGWMCVENKDYQTARKAFQYVTALGEDKPYYFKAESSLLNTRFLEVTTTRSYSSSEIAVTIDEYTKALQRIGKKRNAVPLIIEMCHIKAFYGNAAEDALLSLQEALLIPGITDMEKAEIKMELADIHVLHGDIWEASLFYMQVETDFKFEPIGFEAKFKNARIFYFDGEFDFAQSQLSVLKESTSKLIANDALKLSVMITDNFGLDSNYQAMQWFAQGDLLIEQHKFTDAYKLFDSIIATYPYHSLGDEILLRKAKAMEMQGLWNEAVLFLEELLKYHKEDILADDALFMLGDLFENQLNNKEKAADYYKVILFDYKGSLYSEEARKRFRALRGDNSAEEGL